MMEGYFRPGSCHPPPGGHR